jgi:ABC-type enterochelin transport system substrate-binding protein
MPRTSTFALVCLFAALAVGLTACGGDDDANLEDYETSVVETRDRVDQALAGISEAQTREAFSKRMEQAAVVISRAADDLDEAGVAEGFEDETDNLTAALRALSNDLQQTAEQFRVTPELFNTQGLAFEGWTKANQVLRALGKQGIAVEPIANH